MFSLRIKKKNEAIIAEQLLDSIQSQDNPEAKTEVRIVWRFKGGAKSRPAIVGVIVPVAAAEDPKNALTGSGGIQLRSGIVRAIQVITPFPNIAGRIKKTVRVGTVGGLVTGGIARPIIVGLQLQGSIKETHWSSIGIVTSVSPQRMMASRRTAVIRIGTAAVVVCLAMSNRIAPGKTFSGKATAGSVFPLRLGR